MQTKGGQEMEAVHAYYNGQAFIPATPVKAKNNQMAIITILDEFRDDISISREKSIEALKRLRGVAKGKMALEDFVAQKV